MNIAGIDLSLTSPAVTILNVDRNVWYSYFLTPLGKAAITIGNLVGRHENLSDLQELVRYEVISTWLTDICLYNEVKLAMFEGYSFGSVSSRLVQIAENCGICKYRLHNNFSIQVDTVPPKTIKKFATGNGNAKKEDMQVAFLASENVDIKKLLHLTDKQWNPSSDIIDSYYIAKYAKEKMTNNGKA